MPNKIDMELDDMKNKWNKLGEQSEENVPINNQQLLEITQASYTKNISRIFIPEIILSLFYLFLLFFFIAFNQSFENQIQKLLSYLAIALLITLPVLNLTGIYRFYKTGKLLSSYNETLSLFKNQCKQFISLQYIATGLNILLLLISVILIPRVYSEDLSNTQMIYAFLIGGIVALLLSRRIWKYYEKQIQRNEELLRLLGENN